MKIKQSFLPFALTGLIIGGILSQLIQYVPDHFFFTIIPYYNNQNHFQIPYLYYFWVVYYGVMVLLSYPRHQSILKLYFLTLAPSFLASIPFAWCGYDVASLFFLFLFSGLALTVFNIIYQSEAPFFSYPDNFYALWDSIAISVIGFFFMLLAWVILYATSELFMVIHVSVIRELIHKSSVDVFLTTFFVSMGFWLSIQISGAVSSVRSLFLTSFRYLFVPFSIIGILFIVSMIITRQFHIETGHTSLFLFIAFASIIFTNAVYQDGLEDHSFHRVIQWILTVYLCVAPIFAFFALYGIYFYGSRNIHDNGLTLYNFPILVNGLLLLFYNLTYAIASIAKQKPWLKPIEKGNIFLAFILILLTLVISNPWIMGRLPKPPSYVQTVNVHDDKLVVLSK